MDAETPFNVPFNAIFDNSGRRMEQQVFAKAVGHFAKSVSNGDLRACFTGWSALAAVGRELRAWVEGVSENEHTVIGYYT